ncbi:MAG: hypothetical protein M0P37_10910 [Synergistaceae bacterium]|nr:hypothetical protein [Synergistaceae bacterium]
MIQYCRYYKGEEECPEFYNGTDFDNVWFYEKVWANSETDRDEKGCNTTEYIAYGMKEFNADDGVPITLKAMLFNRYCRGNGGGVENEKEHFKKWYQKLYPASE